LDTSSGFWWLFAGSRSLKRPRSPSRREGSQRVLLPFLFVFFFLFSSQLTGFLCFSPPLEDGLKKKKKIEGKESMDSNHSPNADGEGTTSLLLAEPPITDDKKRRGSVSSSKPRRSRQNSHISDNEDEFTEDPKREKKFRPRRESTRSDLSNGDGEERKKTARSQTESPHVSRHGSIDSGLSRTPKLAHSNSELLSPSPLETDGQVLRKSLADELENLRLERRSSLATSQPPPGGRSDLDDPDWDVQLQREREKHVKERRRSEPKLQFVERSPPMVNTRRSKDLSSSFFPLLLFPP